MSLSVLRTFNLQFNHRYYAWIIKKKKSVHQFGTQYSNLKSELKKIYQFLRKKIFLIIYTIGYKQIKLLIIYTSYTLPDAYCRHESDTEIRFQK